jgi:hypothetical protein
MDRLEALPDGRLRYWFKTAWRNGTTHAIFEPLEFLEKLAALVPTPRAHLVRFHGLLAPAAKWRPSIVPNNATTEAPPDFPGTDEPTVTSSGADVAHCDEREKPADAAERHGRNYAWSELMKRVFAADVLACIHCEAGFASWQPSAPRKSRVRFWITSEFRHARLRWRPPSSSNFPSPSNDHGQLKLRIGVSFSDCITPSHRAYFHPPPKKLRQTWAALAPSQHKTPLCDVATVRKTPQMAAAYLRHRV